MEVLVILGAAHKCLELLSENTDPRSAVAMGWKYRLGCTLVHHRVVRHAGAMQTEHHELPILTGIGGIRRS
ncbi:hypothetical protein ACFV0L_07050 [Streptosporangium canum]|uniref:hypothetical protein n=1 Tax=Streptosporangium canum TaxID=324952 RepID=UPI0036BEE8A6